MDSVQIFVAIFVVLVLAGGFWFLVRRMRSTEYQITRPELRNRAIDESEGLAELVAERESQRPSNDPVIQDHEFAHRRVTSHDEETQKIYHREHLPKVSELRDHFAARNIRNDMLEDLYDSAENEADLRTISTALQEMAARLKTS
jgi:ABC-type nickel/cobalt efflux system permease component RcnA